MSGYGIWTKCPLGETDRVFITPGVPYAPAARMSLELAETAYTLETEPFEDAGFTDFSFISDKKIITGETVNTTGSLLENAAHDLLQHLAKYRMKQKNPLAQMLGIRGQADSEKNSCKAFAMIREDMPLRFTVAIGFMGTGKRLSDWADNFRMDRIGGVHLGFDMLTQAFLDKANEIKFPYAAKQLKLNQLTLSDIFAEMRSDKSRFRLWCAGHSQGGAVLQLFIHQLLMSGVRPEYLVGFGFASPTVCDMLSFRRLSSYPIIHFLHSDDLVTRIGAERHLGDMYVFAAREQEREYFYGEEADDLCFCEMQNLVRMISDTKQALSFMHALVNLAQETDASEFARVMGILPDWLNGFIDGKKDAAVSFVRRRVETAETLLNGAARSPEGDQAYFENAFQEMLTRYTPSELLHGLSNVLKLPHKLAQADDGEHPIAPYQYLVNNELHGLVRCLETEHESMLFALGKRAAQQRRRPRYDRFHGFSAIRRKD